MKVNIVKISILCVAIAAIVVSFSNCRKNRYPEDPRSTTVSPRERLKGSWQILQYTLNGKDITQDLNALADTSKKITNIGFSYYPYGHDGWSFSISGGIHYSNSWAFDDPDFLTIGPNRYHDTLLSKWLIKPFKFDTASGSMASWRVTKLYDKDLHLVLQQDTGEYKIILKKQTFK